MQKPIYDSHDCYDSTFESYDTFSSVRRNKKLNPPQKLRPFLAKTRTLYINNKYTMKRIRNYSTSVGNVHVLHGDTKAERQIPRYTRFNPHT